jgi:hypothetical protein
MDIKAGAIGQEKYIRIVFKTYTQKGKQGLDRIL